VRDIVLLVHSKLATVQERIDFENARRHLGRPELELLAAEALARAALPTPYGRL
jgi:hypothetical protein